MIDSFSHSKTPRSHRAPAESRVIPQSETSLRYATALLIVFSVALVVHAAARPAWGQEATEKDAAREESTATVQEWVDLLSSDNFDERERAGEQLIALGRDSLAALEAAKTRSEDPEQLLRLQKVIEGLQKQDLQTRIDSFLGGASDDLENWPIMEKAFGDSLRVRELFVDLTQTYPELVRSLSGTALELNAAFVKTRSRMKDRGIGIRAVPERVEVIGLLLLSDSPNFRPPFDMEMLLLSWLHQRVAYELRYDREFGTTFLAMTGRWMETTSIDNRTIVLRKALEWELPVARRLALETLKIQPNPELLARCLQAISRQGSIKDTELFLKYLDDSRPLLPIRALGVRRNVVEVGDVAAASIAYVADVPATEIGFAVPVEDRIYGVMIEQLTFPGSPDELKEVEQARKKVRAAARKLVPKSTPAESEKS